jgi:hypothetical protein
MEYTQNPYGAKEHKMQYDLKNIFEQFDVKGEFVQIQPFGSGHINDTFLVETSGGEIKKYLLQRINHFVFRNPPKLMNNLKLIYEHLQSKKNSAKISQQELNCFTFFPTQKKKFYFQDSQGNYWRLGVFIEDSRSYDIVDSPQKAYLGGKAFGRFLALLSDFPVQLLHYSIPDFHNMEKRLVNFSKVMTQDSVHRAGDIQPEIRLVQDHAEEMKNFHQMGIEGKIPIRVTHNDTKFNNILFDSRDHIIGVIDLDTVMPGHVHSDFGDAIRTCTNTGAEDDPDLDKVTMNIDLFEAYAKGYLHETKQILKSIEIEHLAFSAKFLTFMQGLRFLTDYLEGDVYYKTLHPKHNLQRTRAQFKLFQDMEVKFDKNY